MQRKQNKVEDQMTSAGTQTGNFSRRIYSVTEFSGSLSLELANKFPSVCVRGEVTNLSKPRSGHWYFSLRDEEAQIRSVMFRGSNLSAHQIKEGEEIIACGKPGIYKDRGDLQLIVSHLQLAGAGDLQKQFDDLKKELQQKGYFDRERKKDLPLRPKKVAVITSASGAVIHDIQTVTARRAPILPMLLLPASVQGSEAINSIVESISIADRHSEIDLILLARGGGSLEDFAAFNSLQVAGAINQCKTPLICAVGHESDVSIADMVADIRAATPSEAAEIITQGYISANEELAQINIRARQSLENSLNHLHRNLQHSKSKLQNPSQQLRNRMQRLDSLELLLESRVKLLVQKRAKSLLQTSQSISLRSLKQSVAQKENELVNQKARLVSIYEASNHKVRQRFTNAIQLLDAMSPLAVLSRGYGITTNEIGNVITSSSQVIQGQTIRTQLEDGSIKSTVIDTISSK